ncbi:hypothetical protein P7K49_039926, partial [Saguinus oedipus]
MLLLGSLLLWRAPVSWESLCYGRLPRQRQAASALGGTSIGADRVSGGGRPSLTGLHRPRCRPQNSQ